MLRSISREMLCTIHLSFGFLFLFMGFTPTQNISSVIHKNDGPFGLALLYFFFGIGCFISPVLSKKIGLVKSLFFSGLTYALFIISSTSWLNFFYYPASMIIGLGAAVLWTSQPTYLSRAAPLSQVGTYSAIFTGIYTCGGITGNALSGVFAQHNFSVNLELAIFGSFSTVGSILLGLLASMAPKTTESNHDVRQTLIHVFKCFKDTRILLLLPVLFLQGQTQGYFFSIIPVLVGLQETGFVMVMFGVFAVAGSSIWGKLHDKLGKKPMLLAMLVLLPLSLTLSSIGREKAIVLPFYFASALNGMFDSLQSIYIFAIISSIYPTNNISQYSSTRFVMSMSTAISYFAFRFLPYYFVLPWLLVLLAISLSTQLYLIHALKNRLSGSNINYSVELMHSTDSSHLHDESLTDGSMI
ncbi:hypothetical protein SAMD00019534_071080 [Acytostelium subglobosum LB1]|uniref:hypothetical protein n=1 Tax=Acytostelium subglobosum LB1 TaxID=1410327 RepID=UPI00064480C9|nr:hypothetical protein SAMD00019534_071080 [Acytostelium subglobosum LB1]GAM23933.1 hypothetical protein SAMD00019534_071080 [Acytostelium subglobosum LB1]|eukprot:XP_012752969.1 hypothetical protein SAMD00019534_071080 [Acytostelium subglobosum LB1]